MARLAPSGSGSGDSGSGSGDSGSGGSSGVLVEGSGNLQLTPTNYSHNNYRWDISGIVKWSATGRMVLVDGKWILDTPTLSMKNVTINVNIKGRTYTESGVDYVSVSKKVDPSEIGGVVNAGSRVSAVARTSVEGYAKEVYTETEIPSLGYNSEIVLNISFLVVQGGVRLEAEMGTISVSGS